MKNKNYIQKKKSVFVIQKLNLFKSLVAFFMYFQKLWILNIRSTLLI